MATALDYNQLQNSSTLRVSSINQGQLENGAEKIFPNYDLTTRIHENISYARILQRALFKKGVADDKLLDRSFVLDMPKDMVGGDFYLFEKIQNKRVIFLGDCTGHGVSGAIMTALCVSIARELLQKYKTLSPSLVLVNLQERIAKIFEHEGDTIMDGCDATMVIIDEQKKKIRSASTNQSIHVLNEKTCQLVRGTRIPIHRSVKLELEDVTTEYEPDSMLYLSSDGIKDQMGGERGKKFSAKRFTELLSSCHHEKEDVQYHIIKNTLDDWMQNEDQTDDILVIGSRLK